MHVRLNLPISNLEKMDKLEDAKNVDVAPRENQKFSTFKEMYTFLINYANITGFRITRKETHRRKSSDGVEKGEYQNGAFGCGQRAGQSLCGFLIRFYYSKNGYVFSRLNLSHECKLDRSMISQHGKLFKAIEQHLSQEEKDMLERLSLAYVSNSTVAQIMERCFSTVYDRELVRLMVEKFRGSHEKPWAFNILEMQRKIEQRGGRFRVDHNPNNLMVRAMMWQTATMEAYQKAYGDVVVVDGTHLTNSNGFILLAACVVDCFLTSQYVGFSFCRTENAEDIMEFLKFCGVSEDTVVITDEGSGFERAANIMGFKHVLCTWHVSVNISAKQTVRGFKDYCNTLLYEDFCDEEHFERFYHSTLAQYHGYNKESDILKGIYRKREKLARVYTKRFFTAGCSTTQRAESMNSKLKGRSKGDLSKLTIADALERIETMVDADNLRKMDDIRNCVARSLQYPSSIMKMVEKEILSSDKYCCDENSVWRHDLPERKRKIQCNSQEPACTCFTHLSYGIPCRHLVCWTRRANNIAGTVEKNVWLPSNRYLVKNHPLFHSNTNTVQHEADTVLASSQVQTVEALRSQVQPCIEIAVPRGEHRYVECLHLFKRILANEYGPRFQAEAYKKFMYLLSVFLNSLAPNTSFEMLEHASGGSSIPGMQILRLIGKESLVNRSLASQMNK
jgi:hypothetical protein